MTGGKAKEKSILDAITHQPVVTGGVWALGNFDGVHLGHRAVIAAAVQEGKRLALPVHALTFDPHPHAFFQKDKRPFLLTPPEAKRHLLLEAGADDVATLPFTPAFAALTPEAFIQDVLIGACQAAHVVVGFDFVFGRGRGGDGRALRQKLEPLGVGVTSAPPKRDEGGEIISSSRIRAAVRKGDVASAAKLLGRPFTLSGVVLAGEGRGRTLGFPTANIALGALAQPLQGVYAIKARSQEGGGETFCGVANFGVRPTFGEAPALLEVHLFDFNGDIYGQVWEVELHRFLRPEMTFDGLAALQAQIQKDVEAARQTF
ncbi:MAG: bifunctional riboflavin kinase/FAD synthetase [Bdellovibrionales bacterium]|jgi:riboflavin kinase/FMN adenylyltransferase